MTKFTYSGIVKIARLDGANVQDIRVGNTVSAQDQDDVEAICHLETQDSVEKAFPGYRILKLPTLTNGELTVRVASDAGW